MGPFRFLFVAPIQPDIMDFTPPPSRVKVDVAFAAPDTQLPACQNAQLLWNFSDGNLVRGRTARPTSQRPGKYLVRFSILGYGSNACIGSHGVIRAKRWSSSHTGNEVKCESRWADAETRPFASLR